MLKERFLGLACAVICVIAIATSVVGCSGYGTAPATPPAGTPGATSSQTKVSISNFAFAPQTLQIAKGTTVTWTNNDSAQHTVTSDTNLFDSGPISNGATFNYTFNEAGTFNYHCNVHPSMLGKVTVQ